MSSILPIQCGKRSPRLVAVSKKQPLEKVQWAYHQGLQHFGENYVREERCCYICSKLFCCFVASGAAYQSNSTTGMLLA